MGGEGLGYRTGKTLREMPRESYRHWMFEIRTCKGSMYTAEQSRNRLMTNWQLFRTINHFHISLSVKVETYKRGGDISWILLRRIISKVRHSDRHRCLSVLKLFYNNV